MCFEVSSIVHFFSCHHRRLSSLLYPWGSFLFMHVYTHYILLLLELCLSYALLNDITFFSLFSFLYFFPCNSIWCHMKPEQERDPLFHAAHYSIPHNSRTWRTTNYWTRWNEKNALNSRAGVNERLFLLIQAFLIWTSSLKLEARWKTALALSLTWACVFSFFSLINLSSFSKRSTKGGAGEWISFLSDFLYTVRLLWCQSI